MYTMIGIACQRLPSKPNMADGERAKEDVFQTHLFNTEENWGFLNDCITLIIF